MMSYVKLKNKNLNMKNKWVLYGNDGLLTVTTANNETNDAMTLIHKRQW